MTFPKTTALSFLIFCSQAAAGLFAQTFPSLVYDVPHRPVSMIDVDVNGDGHADLLTLNTFSPLSAFSLSALMGDGRGSFAPEIRTTLDADAWHFSPGHVDADGFVDLVLVDLFGGNVRLMRGIGDGTFEPFGGFTVSPPIASSLLADLDGDGHDDLCVSHYPMLSIYRGSGTGEFEEITTVNTFSFPIVAEDIDDDGSVDLVLAGYESQQVFVYFGPLLAGLEHVSKSVADVSRFIVNRPSHLLPTPLTLEVGSSPRDLLVADIDGNGHMDIAVANEGSNSVSLLRGLGNRTFQPKLDFAVGTRPSGIDIGDFNDDGRLDLAVVHAPALTGIGSEDVSLLYGDPNLVFRSEIRLQPLAILVAAGDFDEDGQDDLAVAAPDYVRVLPGDDDEVPGRSPTFVPAGRVTGIEPGDFNQDEIPDLALVRQWFPDEFKVLPGDGQGGFGPPAEIHPVDSFSLSIGEINNDGYLDAFMWADGTKGLSFLGDGSGRFSRVEFALSYTFASALADFDRDGWTDLLLGRPYDDVAFARGNGDGVFQPATTILSDVRYPVDLEIGDLNNDGLIDAMISDRPGFPFFDLGGRYLPLLGSGDGTFQAGEPLAAAGANNISLNDMNLDGTLDLVAATFQPGDLPCDIDVLPLCDIGVFYGLGNGSFDQKSVLVESDRGFADVTTGDLNADGVPDIAAIRPVWYPAGFDVLLFHGTGNGSFHPFQHLYFENGELEDDTRPTNIKVADFNHDRRMDLVVSVMNDTGFAPDPNAGLYILLNEGPFPDARPVAAMAGPSVFECNEIDGASLTLDGSGSTDADSSEGTNDDIALFEWYIDKGFASERLLGTGEILPTELPLGQHAVTLVVHDTQGESDEEEIVIEVRDTTPPAITLGFDPVPHWGGGNGPQGDGHGSDGGGPGDKKDQGKHLEVRFQARDICDDSLTVVAYVMLPGCEETTVISGTQVKFKVDVQCDIDQRDRFLDLEGESLTLRVEGSDSSANSSRRDAQPLASKGSSPKPRP